MTRGEFHNIFKQFAQSHNMPMTDLLLESWSYAFLPMEKEQFLAAIFEFEKRCTEYPTPARMMRYAGAFGVSDEERANVAWGSVVTSIKRYGYMDHIEFDDPLIHAAVRHIGGMAYLRDLKEGQLQYQRSPFIQAYVTAARTGVGDGSPLRGIGGQEYVEKVAVGLPVHSVVKRLSFAGQQDPDTQTVAALPDFGADRNDDK